ncbi:putative uncharacterized protein [Bacteroides sp. CAG:598]|nr:putative uncharacterized protein [Bacteroides sp. CAG:598]
MKYFIRIFLLLFVCLRPVIAVSQNSVAMSGIITDKQGIPLPLVAVAINGTSAGTYTDDNGAYSLRVHPGEIAVVVSSIGYKTIKKTVVIHHDKTLNFTLEEDAVTLNSVEVYGKSQTQKMREGALSLNTLDVRSSFPQCP